VALVHQVELVTHATAALLLAELAVTHLVALQPQAVQAVQEVMLVEVRAVTQQAEPVELLAMPTHLQQAYLQHTASNTSKRT
jgi:hypothetical protein